MAESLAFNRQSIGDIGGVLAGYDLPEAQRRYLRFFHRNFERYRDVENLADVAVLHSFASMGFNNDRPAVSTMLFEQALIQAKVPFDIIFDDNLKDLSRYRVLVLADQEALDEDKLKLIRQYVEQGGGLVATELSSLYTEWRERRRDFGLQDLLGVESPRYQRSRGGEPPPRIAAARRQAGRGRAAYIPEVKAAIQKPSGARMTSQYWKLPLNAAELVEAVRWAAGGQFSLEVAGAPPTVVAELMRQKADRLLVHLVNYDVARTPVLRNIRLTVQLPPAARVRSVDTITPDEDGADSPRFEVAGGRVTFTGWQPSGWKAATERCEQEVFRCGFCCGTRWLRAVFVRRRCLPFTPAVTRSFPSPRSCS